MSAVLQAAASLGWLAFGKQPPPPPPPARFPSSIPDWRQSVDWAPPWTLYLAFAIGAAGLLWQLQPAPAKQGKGGKSSGGGGGGGSVPAPPKEVDECDPSLLVAAYAYLGYAYLISRGYFLDFLQYLVGLVFFWRREAQVPHPNAGPPISAKCGPPFNTGWVIFYTRRLYKRIEDCWNRPIAGQASSTVEVLLRKKGAGDASPHLLTGEKKLCTNLGSYNYLGFGGWDPICTPAVIQALREHGVSACSSRMEAGHTPVHAQLEETVASFLEKEAAVVVGMGFATNSSIIPVIVDAEGNGKGVLLISDALNHSSIVEGVRGSGAKVQPFAHNNMAHLEAILRRATSVGQPGGAAWRKIIIMVEGIYSMEGQFAKLREIVALKKRFNAFLYLDEAHSIGAVGPRGRGVTDHLGIPTSEVDVMMGTFTKSFGSIGGYVAGPASLVATIRRHAAASLYSAAFSPPAAQQALSALRIIMGNDPTAGSLGTQRMARLRDNSNKFREGLIRMGCRVLGDRDSPVIPIMLYHPEKIYNFSQSCLKRDIAAVVVGYPATPLLLSRARFCIAASHTEEQLDGALLKIAECARENGIRYDLSKPEAAKGAADPDHVAKERARLLKTASMEGEPETAWRPEPLAPAGGIPGHFDPSVTYEHAVAASGLKPKNAALDLRTTDFLQLSKAAEPLAAAESALRHYGCGTCGPRGFYGTLDVHLTLEQRLASFLGVEAAIIYSFGIAAPSSVVPAFVRKGDVLFYDEGIHFTTATGVKLSRGTSRAFPHNDLRALELMLAQQADRERTLPANKRARRFLLVEGLYANGGGLCNLPKLLELRDAYGCYLIVDESLSFGTLGKTGRGIAEHYGLEPRQIDVLVGTMENSLASVGGFCAGPDWVVAHQRLSGSGYCFSASLPAYATTAAIAAIDVIDAQPSRLANLHAASAAMHKALRTALAPMRHIRLDAHPASPVAHVGLTPAARGVLSAQQLETLLRDAATLAAKADGGACCQLMLHSGLAHIQTPLPPTLRLCVHSAVPLASLDAAAAALAAALQQCLDKHSTILARCTVDDIIDNPEEELAAANAEELRVASPKKDKGGRGVASLYAVPSVTDLASVGGGGGAMADEATPRPAGPRPTDSPTTVPGGANTVAAALAGDSELTLPVTVPVLYFLEYVRQASRNYVLRQMEWHSFSLQPQLQALRSAKAPMLHAVLTVGQLLGSELFYFMMIPILCWTLDDAHSNSNMFVAYFGLNVYVCNWLKNCFALARSDAAPTTRDTSDFGWPSMYALNAVGLPFFLLRYLFGAVGHGTLYSLENQALTAACYSAGILWVLVVCGARLYSGVSSPADVQGGMLVGGVLVRIWLPVCEDVATALSSSDILFGLPSPIFMCVAALLLMLMHPFTPGDPRSWTALAYSTKAVAFATAFIIGSNHCASVEWCSPAARAVPAAATYVLALRAVLRCVVGFAMLAVGTYTAAAAARLVEPQLQAAMPTKKCAAPIMRNLFVFAANGAMVSIGVPSLLKHLSL